MLHVTGLHFYRWSKFYAFVAVSSLTLQCCGSGLTRGNTEGLQVFLEIPAGEEPSLFWYGVHRKVLGWAPTKENRQEIEWNTNARPSWDLREGDKLEFLGTDDAGRLIVTGEATVTEEKKATIPLRRVL